MRYLRASALVTALACAMAFPGTALSGTPPEGKGEITGGSVCRGSAEAVSDDGTVVGTVTGSPGSSASTSEPFVVDAKGEVNYSGSITHPLGNGSYKVTVDGITVKSGSLNDPVKLDTTGSIDLGDTLPFALKGPKAWGEFTVHGSDGKCDGGVWIKFHGSPTGSVPWLVGLVTSLLGLAGIGLSLPRRLGA